MDCRTRLLWLSALLLLGVVRPAPAERDVVKFATVNANYRAALEEIVRRYEQKRPDVEIELALVPRNFETWIRTRVAAGGDLTPDIYNPNFTQGYDRQGKWTVLDPYLEQISPYTGKPWGEGLDLNLIERYKYAGNVYQIPIDFIEIAVFYNKDIFDELGLGVPRDWAEFLETCETLQRNGYIPLGISGIVESFWAGDMGWLVRMFCDAYLRHHVPEVMARPGDWDYRPERNADYEYDADDLYSDLLVIVSSERMLNAVRDGTISPTNPRFKRVYAQLKKLSQYFQPGYLGSDLGAPMQMFYQQKSGMVVQASPMVTGIVRDFRKLPPEERFNYGAFWFPPITDDPLVCGPFRGVGGAGMALAVHKQDDPEHLANVIDFLMYLTSPEAGRLLVEKTLEDDQPLIGPMCIKGVELPEEIADKFKVFQGHGFEKINFRGLQEEQESVAEWGVIVQEYFGDRMTLDEFAEGYREVLLGTIPRLQKRMGYDLDPTTRDYAPNSLQEQLKNINAWVDLARSGSGAAAAFREREAPAVRQTVDAIADKLDGFRAEEGGLVEYAHPDQRTVWVFSRAARAWLDGEMGDAAFLERLDRLGEEFGGVLAGTRSSLWNPFENGSLMVAIILLLFSGYGLYCVFSSKGGLRYRTTVAFTLLLPTFFLLGAFAYFPALSGLYHAFTDWEEGSVATFNGLDNFRRMLDDEVFFAGFGNMIILMLASLFKNTVVPFIAAEMILFVLSDRLRYIIRTLFLVPMVVPMMVGILIWKMIYDPNMGLLNQALVAIGQEGLTRSWLGEPQLALPAVIFMGFPWIGAIGLLIYMAGLMSIPDSVHESYRLESDNVLRRLMAIDVPLVRNQFRLLVILTFIGSLQDFQTILIFTDGGPGMATTVPALRMYHQAFRFSHFGYGSAIGLILFLLVLGITIINMKVFKKVEME